MLRFLILLGVVLSVPLVCHDQVALAVAIQPQEPTDGVDAKRPDVSGVVRLPPSGTDRPGEPAAGADVYLRLWKPGATILPTHPLKSQTDDQGRFQFTDLPAGSYRVWAETDKWTTLTKFLGGEEVVIDGEPLDEPLSLQLKESCHYRVLVRSENSQKPIESAKISFGWTDIERAYLTDASGVANIGGLVARDWFFVVSAAGHATQFKKIPSQEAGRTTELEFTLAPGGTIEGEVIDDRGEPVADVRVTATSTRGGMLPNFGRVSTDSRGRFRIEGLPLGEAVRVGCSPDGFERVDEQLVIPRDEATIDCKLRIRRRPYGGDCLILVTTESGEPIAGAKLKNEGNSSSLVREGTTDADGLCLLSNLYESFAGHVVTARARGLVARSVAVEPGTKDDPGQAIIKLVAGKTLRGRLLTPAGKPAAKVRVYYNRGENGSATGGRVDTDEDGRFEIDGLEDTVLLTVYTPREFAPIKQRRFAVDEEQELELKMTPAAVLRVRAVDALTGQPISEFNVRVSYCQDPRPGDPSPGGILTSLVQQGENVMGTKKAFTLDHQQPGTPYEIIVSALGYEATTVPRLVATIDAPVTDVSLHRVDPSKYRRISGRLIDADGNPVIGVKLGLVVGSKAPELQMVAPDNFRLTGWRFYHWDVLVSGSVARDSNCLQFLRAATDTEGRFEFKGVRADAAWYELFHEGGEVAPGRFPDLGRTHEGKLDRLELTAAPPSKLIISVDLEKWADGHGIAIRPSGGFSGASSLLDPIGHQTAKLDPATGTATFEGLPAGDYAITLQAAPEPLELGFRVQGLVNGSITVKAGETNTYRFD